MMLTDLDGTLLNSKRRISPKNFSKFSLLKQQGITRVAATGRSVYSVRQVLPTDFPIDFLIFSSGAGIMDWKTGNIIRSRSLQKEDIQKVADFFLEHELDFSIHDPIPDTHYFYWYGTSTPNTDFLERLHIYRKFARQWDHRMLESASQLLAITDNHQKILSKIRNNFEHLNIIRTTSPLNLSSVWIEVFPADVSKGTAAEWLCNELNVDPKLCMSIGNDFNDLAMLEWAHKSFVMQNAAEELKRNFEIVPDNDNDGFSCAIDNWLKDLQ